MKIEFLGQAGLFIEENNSKLLCDPWVSESGGFLARWHQYPPNMNLDLEKIKKLFISFKIPEGRGDMSVVKKFNKRFKFIDESYNASPKSMTSAIENISSLKRKNKGRKLVFLGDMLELGKKSKKFHKILSNTINKSDIDKVFVYGKYIRETFNSLNKKKRGKTFNNLREAYNYFGKIIHNNDLLMIKGSNATGLNQFSKSIKKEQSSVI